MSVLRFSVKRMLALVSVLSVSSSIVAEPDIEGFGLRAEAVYWFGDKHVTQDRWVANFAVANSAQLIRYANPIVNRHRSHINDLNYEPAIAAFQYRSAFAVQFNFTSLGDRTTMLWGVPVAAKISPVRSVNGQSSSWMANPWVWVGAVVVGAAASSGGSGGGGGSGSSGSETTLVGGDGSCGTEGGTVVGSDGTVNTDDPSSSPGDDSTSVETGCAI